MITRNINEYSIQYWLYAVLNVKFGQQLKFVRSNLQSRYIVNRHDFEVIPIFSKTKASFTYLYEYLCHQLVLAGYVKSTNITDMYVKSFGSKTAVIVLSYGVQMDGKLHLNITSYVHNDKIRVDTY